MQKKSFILYLLFLFSFSLFAETKNSKQIHESQHKQLLATSRTSAIDKSVIEEYFRQELEGGGANKLSENEQLVIDLLDEAKSHLGKGYRSGGKGPNVFDCSGFAGYVYRQFGFDMGASSRDQFTQGITVEKDDLKPGDLVFFTGRNSNSGRIGHVGIVVEANNDKGMFTFIHASTSGGIKYDSNIGYYGKRYVGAKRIITD